MQQLVMEKNMDYDMFVNSIKRIVKERMGEGYEIKIFKVIKNNSLELDSLVVLRAGKNFAPNIYLMPYYDSYLEGTPLITIVDRLCNIYRHCSVPIVDENFIYTLEEMKPYIFFRLVSYSRNEKLLDKIPYKKYLDLAVTFHCLVRNDDEGIGTIRITNEQLKLWKLSLEDLNKLAVENTKRLFPATIKSMEEVLRGVYEELTLDNRDELPVEIAGMIYSNRKSPGYKMYILTNQKGINGASCLLYEDVLRSFADQLDSDLYILPSSIHEIILVPKIKDLQKDGLRRMVEDVNRTQVALEEILSDHVYLFSRKLNSILL